MQYYNKACLERVCHKSLIWSTDLISSQEVALRHESRLTKKKSWDRQAQLRHFSIVFAKQTALIVQLNYYSQCAIITTTSILHKCQENLACVLFCTVPLYKYTAQDNVLYGYTNDTSVELQDGSPLDMHQVEGENKKERKRYLWRSRVIAHYMSHILLKERKKDERKGKSNNITSNIRDAQTVCMATILHRYTVQRLSKHLIL